MAHMFTFVLAASTAAALAGTAAGAAMRAVDVVPLAGATDVGEIVSSEAKDALDRPELWRCESIFPDYQRWLDDGKPAENWKYVDRTYRDSETGKLYDWQDWLDWVDDAGCVAAPLHNNTAGLAIGAGVAALGAGLLVGMSGSDAKSPG